MDHCVSEIRILPLQTQALGDSKARACSQERQGTFRLSQITNDFISLFGSYDHRFVSAGRLAANEAHRVLSKVAGWRKRLATFSSDDILAVHSRIRLAVL